MNSHLIHKNLNIKTLKDQLRLLKTYLQESLGNTYWKLIVDNFEGFAFVPLIRYLDYRQCQVFLSIVQKYFGRLCLSATDIDQLAKQCQSLGINSLSRVHICSLTSDAGPVHSNAMEALIKLIPNLMDLHANVRLIGGFSNKWSNLRVLHLYNGICQMTLDSFFENSQQLSELIIVENSLKHPPLSIDKIHLCEYLTELIIPLNMNPPFGVLLLENLKLMTLQTTIRSAAQDWIPTVRIIINLKQAELRELRLDASFSTTSFDLTAVDLGRCPGLSKVSLSNCQFMPHSKNFQSLPITCTSLCFKRCQFTSVSTLYRYIYCCPLLRRLQLIENTIIGGDNHGDVSLRQLLRLRNRQPTVCPLVVQYNKMAALKSELATWTKEYRAVNMDLLDVSELKKYPCEQPPGSITMAFGIPIR